MEIPFLLCETGSLYVTLISLEHVVVAQEGLTHGALSLPLPLEHWCDRRVPALCVVGVEPRTLCCAGESLYLTELQPPGPETGF